jgi:pimeloyl-ACP methyl ester carboxylesterase
MLERLIVMNIPHPVKFAEGLRTPQQLLRSSYAFFFQLPVLPELLIQWSDYQALESGFKGMAVNKSAITAADIETYKNAASRRGALTAMLNYYRNAFPSVLKQDWSILQVPTLMIWGEEDQALGKELTYGTQEYVQNFQLRYIPNCSHWVQQEQPEVVNRYIREFLATSG